MQKRFLVLFAFGLLLESAAYGQSLGDIARANREKQSPDTAATKPAAVITNDDLGQDPQGTAAPAGTVNRKKSAHHDSGVKQPVDERAAAQWKKQILAEKDKIAILQGRIDEINATIHPPGSAQFEGPPNRFQTLQLQKIAEIKVQLDEHKSKLTQMQEEARQAGMHTTVYDP